jgi:hypothetical protein
LTELTSLVGQSRKESTGGWGMHEFIIARRKTIARDRERGDPG